MAVNRNWSAAPKDIVDPVVDHLIRVKRWTQDCPSLRALNKHWCTALSQRIVEVHPHWSRVLKVEDINSLSKFSNLTALDVDAFGLQNVARIEDTVMQLKGVLSTIPHLKRLYVKQLTSQMRDTNPTPFTIQHVMNQMKENRLQFIERLKESGVDENLIFDCAVMSMISEHAIQELIGSFSMDILNTCIPEMPSLKVLSMDKHSFGSKESFYQFISVTKNLDSLSMALQADWMDERMTEMHHLVSLKITDGTPRTFEPIEGLHQLTSLDFHIKDGAILTSMAFKAIQKRLMSLKVHSCHRCPFPNDVLKNMAALESLSLNSFSLDKGCNEVLQNLPLMNLSLKHCIMSDNLSSLSKLTKLTRLRLKDTHGPALELDGLNLMHLQNLRTLILAKSSISVNVKLLKEIHSLKNLESLSIDSPHIINVHSDTDREALKLGFPAETFEALEDLPQLSYMHISGKVSKTTFERIMSMKMLLDLEELMLNVEVKGMDLLDMLSTASALGRKAPRLKLTVMIT